MRARGVTIRPLAGCRRVPLLVRPGATVARRRVWPVSFLRDVGVATAERGLGGKERIGLGAVSSAVDESRKGPVKCCGGDNCR